MKLNIKVGGMQGKPGWNERSFIKKEKIKKGRGDHTADPREVGYRRPSKSGRQK